MKQLSIFNKGLDDHAQKPSMRVPGHWKIYVDGASRNNPGLSGAGICIMRDDAVVEEQGYFLGVKTNNQAEYLALVIGLMHVRMLMSPQEHITVISDSQLLIRQLSGHYKVRNSAIKKIYTVAYTLLQDLQYDLQHVLRDCNQRADALANKGIDERIVIPVAIQHALIRHAIMV